MAFKHFAAKAMQGFRIGLTSVALLQFSLGASIANAHDRDDDHHHGKTASPIKHVIVIVGENRTFDHIFATYEPKHG